MLHYSWIRVIGVQQHSNCNQQHLSSQEVTIEPVLHETSFNDITISHFKDSLPVMKYPYCPVVLDFTMGRLSLNNISLNTIFYFIQYLTFYNLFGIIKLKFYWYRHNMITFDSMNFRAILWTSGRITYVYHKYILSKILLSFKTDSKKSLKSTT